MNSPFDARPPGNFSRPLLAFFLLAGVLGLASLVLAPFLVSVAWAVVIAHATWPAYAALQRNVENKPMATALLAAVCVSATIVLPFLGLTFLLQRELSAWHAGIEANLGAAIQPLSAYLAKLPWVGSALAEWTAGLAIESGATHVQLQAQLADWFKDNADSLPYLATRLGRNLAKFAFSMIVLFVLYRDGEALAARLHAMARTILGQRVDDYWEAASSTTRAVMLSVVFASLIQGAVAALGYWVFGVTMPALLGVATALLALVPLLGTALIWVPVAIGLALDHHPWQALGMVAWGALLVHPIDNVLRPLLISSAARIPFLLSMFGVLGGIAAFGLIGLFIGPVVLTTAYSIWNEWSNTLLPAVEAAPSGKARIE
ncbi:MAG TPA: AI-2E family transporter [Burkholderiaceae bacterium]